MPTNQTKLFLLEVAVCTLLNILAEVGFMLIEPTLALLIYGLCFSLVHTYLYSRYKHFAVWCLVPVAFSVLNYIATRILRPEIFDHYPGEQYFFDMEFWLRFIYACFLLIVPVVLLGIVKVYKHFIRSSA